MLDRIYKTTDRKPPIALIYGPAGVGKTTFASKAPAPIFLQTEDGAQGLSVDALPVAQTWQEVLDGLVALAKQDHKYKTVVVDALDGVERLIWSAVAADEGKPSIEAIPYGKGYVLALSQWTRLLSACAYLRDKKGMRTVFLAHALIKRFASPDLPEYDRYQPRLHDKALSLVLEHCDLCGFARHETLTREEGNRTQGVSTGRRILCVSESAAYVAKNRYGLTNTLTLAWQDLAAAIKDNNP